MLILVLALPMPKTIAAPVGRKYTIGVSIDGLLATHSPLKHGPIGSPRPGADAFLKRLARVARIVIYTSRCQYDLDMDRPQDSQVHRVVDPVSQWLNDNKLFYDGIWVGQGKPDCDLYLGPKEINTPLNPTPDDFVQIEREVNTRFAIYSK